jgi:sugar phosphate isomerase/epimerase
MVEEDEGAGIPEFEEMPVDKRFGNGLVALSRTVPADQIYLLQISDAYKPEPKSLKAREVDGRRPRARWSHAFRPLPYHGGYLPVEAVTRAVLGTGFRGWFSVEVFDGGPRGEGKARDMHAFARMARESVDKLIQRSAPVSAACYKQ